MFFLFHLLKTNNEKALNAYNQQSQMIEFAIQSVFEKISDSLDKVAQSKEFDQFLTSSMNDLPFSQTQLEKFLKTEKEKITIKFDYCFYDSNFFQLFEGNSCPHIKTSGNGITLISNKGIYLYKTFLFQSEYGDYKLIISSIVSLLELKKKFPYLDKIELRSQGLLPISLKVQLKKDVLNFSSLPKITIFIFGSMIFFLLSILYGIKISYRLKRKAEKSEKLALIGKVAHFLAHDIKKPFQIIQFFQDEMTRCNTQIQIKNLIEKTDSTLNASKNLIQGTIADLINSSNHTLNVRLHIDLKELLEKCMLTLKSSHRFNENNIQLKINHKLFFDGDEVQITRAFMNILSNAFDATQDTLDAKINVHSFDKNGKIYIVFHNTHSFVSKQNIKKIFEPFFSTKGQNGYGLGLSNSKKIVELHGGRLSCYSNKIEGVKFVIELPANSGNTVILVDDCPLTHRSWKRYFTSRSEYVNFISFKNYEDLLGWLKTYNKQKNKIIQMICDYSIQSSQLSTKSALKKIRLLFKEKIYISTHMEKTFIENELKNLDIIYLSK